MILRAKIEETNLQEPTITAGYPKALLMFAVSRGADRATLLDRSQIASADLADPESRVPLSRYMALIAAAAEATHDKAVALHFGEAVRMQDITLVGLVCEVAETPAEVLQQLNRYASLLVDEGSDKPSMLINVTADDRGAWIELVSHIWCSHPPMIEAELTRLVCNTRATFGAVPEFQSIRFPLAAEFAYPEPTYAAEYERVYKAPTMFGSKRNALLIDPRFALLHQPPADRYVFGVLNKRADELLKQLESVVTTRAKVERALMPILHTGNGNMDVTAARLGIGRRTLLRRLKDEGTTFEHVLDELRRTLALGYLAERKCSVNETAYLVGFSDSSAFSRAFKRWTGVSPRAAQERLIRDQGLVG
jgi:AraC-like DNA-binding protein